MNAPPAFQFYVDDFIAGTVTMSHEERGLYILLLCVEWSHGYLKDDDFDRLGRTVVEPSLNHVRTKFIRGSDGFLRNTRLELERAKQSAYRASQSEKGKRSVQQRFNRGSTAVQPKGEPKGEPKVNSPSPSPCTVPISSSLSSKGTTGNGAALPGVCDLLKMFGRPAGSQLTYAEQSTLSELSRSESFPVELEIIQDFRDRMPSDDRRYFPQSLSRLLESWHVTLDRARNYEPPKAKPEDTEWNADLERIKKY